MSGVVVDWDLDSGPRSPFCCGNEDASKLRDAFLLRPYMKCEGWTLRQAKGRRPRRPGGSLSQFQHISNTHTTPRIRSSLLFHTTARVRLPFWLPCPLSVLEINPIWEVLRATGQPMLRLLGPSLSWSTMIEPQPNELGRESYVINTPHNRSVARCFHLRGQVSRAL